MKVTIMVNQKRSLLETYSLPLKDIERQSFRIIKGLLPDLKLSPQEIQVVTRIVHTFGEPDIARQVLFHPQSIDTAIKALLEGRTIFTDVRMVAVGIKSKLAATLGCQIQCALDLAIDDENEAAGITRTARAMRSLGYKLDGSLVAIGNAPTALLALLDMVEEGKASPAIIIGMPVGFVAATEAKMELAKRNTPFITIQGTRGGSTVTAATVNALMLLAIEGLEKKRR